MSDIAVQVTDHIATITLGRPHCLNIAGKHALTDMMNELATAHIDLRAVIITDGQPGALLVDVAELADMGAEEAAAFSASGHALAASLESAPFPVIAAVEGPALGGGCELVLACDLAIAGSSAVFGQIEAIGGVMPGFGGTWRLARRVGYQRALQLMFTGATIDAATANQFGLVLDTAPEGGAVTAARQLAERISATRAASVTAIKQAAVFAWNRDPALINSFEEERFPQLFGSEQSQRMHAFLEQQKSQPS
jgi:enoyl-CoA hydratase